MHKIAGAIAAMAIAGTANAADVEGLRRAAQAKGIEIEQDAVIGRSFREAQITHQMTILQHAIIRIMVRGWKCDSVSAVRMLILSRGVKIQCNRFAYTYIMEDRGGQWTVRLD